MRGWNVFKLLRKLLFWSHTLYTAGEWGKPKNKQWMQQLQSFNRWLWMWFLHHIYSTHEHLLFKNHSNVIDLFNVFQICSKPSVALFPLSHTHFLKHNDRWDLTVHFACHARWGWPFKTTGKAGTRRKEGERKSGDKERIARDSHRAPWRLWGTCSFKLWICALLEIPQHVKVLLLQSSGTKSFQ